MSFESRLLSAIPGIRHAFLDVHETAAFPYSEMAPVKLVHGNIVHHYQTLLTLPARELTKRYSDRLFHQRSEPFVEAQKASARGEDNLWFDLRAFAQLLLRQAGVMQENIEWLGSCTYCTPQSLGSYRRRTHFPAEKTFQYSWIMREA
ncbi:hypothetical protein GR294_22070 [Raoultella sp. Lac2]|uniref:laccase domain-containing protein n=1 Tax=Klebsiella/Raoultella group TaxID=2890311 RepID=UPI001355B2A5|nr:hypothetical protein [Raoultella sp. Lac2]MXF98959.1 hypothetical protein [Raoultella sp. Lac1]